MASISLERIMDRVSLVFDCETDDEATELYNLLASQALDGTGFNIRLSHVSVPRGCSEAGEGTHDPI